MTTKRDKQQIIVLGAGYAGLLAALRLAPHARVTLVDPTDRFTERVRQHELVARPATNDLPLASLLRGTGVRHLPRRVTALDPLARKITTDNGQLLDYDRLVYALGSRTAVPPGVLSVRSAPRQSAGAPPTGELAPLETADASPRPEPAAPQVFTAETTPALCTLTRDRSGSLAVVGGGLTGIELAAELAESRPAWDVRLLTAGELAVGHSTRGRDHVRRVLTALGVRIEEGRTVADPLDVDADAVVWAAAMVPHTAVAAEAGLALDPASGRVAVDASLRSISHPEIYAVGDAAAAHSSRAGSLRMGCATALPTGSHAATAIIAELRGRAPERLDFGYQLQCVSLGRRDGLVQFVHHDDSPRDRVLTGRTAAWAKERIVRSTVSVMGLARRAPDTIGRLPGF
ncbi:NAD(P)/FAD-dependent oxidoreductase [Streptomyces sp. NPDC056500]|uniref:NAD(P)/FAD-dependent oxidoreductase n=1 Tax=Streptomyces sp. NPDC056500 TaxID=3345840 RepID=UPI0036C2E0F0